MVCKIKKLYRYHLCHTTVFLHWGQFTNCFPFWGEKHTNSKFTKFPSILLQTLEWTFDHLLCQYHFTLCIYWHSTRPMQARGWIRPSWEKGWKQDRSNSDRAFLIRSVELVDSDSATVKTHRAYSVLRGEEQVSFFKLIFSRF